MVSYTNLAEEGSREGQFLLGLYAMHGYPPRWFSDGILSVTQASQGGCRAAFHFPARFYSAGPIQDVDIRAAFAARILAEMFEKGEHVPASPEAANRWWEMAARWDEFIPISGSATATTQRTPSVQPATD